ncbi:MULTISPECIES: hypothetical protein [unclassified Streptomyces]|uniref:hypothetical protein n=1 Tax=unclassified Streptomyces TaxID=2593676 RepID=UPI0022B6CF9C|nr:MULTISPECIES: hypothetical protein [unclassified Streptomyces]MCZ7417702.1 hypothetical protein [Streptomyces sp. WMMC897]MCZ7432502.1 hypothetical protein [Streptomyces sp. WMMC1477]
MGAAHGSLRRPWRRALAVTAVLLLSVVTAVLPQRGSSAAGPVAAEATPLGMPFLPSADPMHVTINSLVAVSLTVDTGVTIRLSDGTTRTTNKYTFTKLKIREHLNMTQRADGHTVVLDVPDTGSLGGYDTQGNPETTEMWGDIDNICVRVLIKICGVQGLLDFFGSIIPLTAGAEDFDATVYAIRTTDDHAALDSTDNPVHLPGTITVTSP